MRAIIQLVKQASVTVEDKTIGQIGQGLLVLLGVGKTDTEEDAGYLADKITGLRIFPDDNALMNRSLLDVAEDAGRLPIHLIRRLPQRPAAIIQPGRAA